MKCKLRSSGIFPAHINVCIINLQLATRLFFGRCIVLTLNYRNYFRPVTLNGVIHSDWQLAESEIVINKPANNAE